MASIKWMLKFSTGKTLVTNLHGWSGHCPRTPSETRAWTPLEGGGGGHQKLLDTKILRYKEGKMKVDETVHHMLPIKTDKGLEERSRVVKKVRFFLVFSHL